MIEGKSLCLQGMCLPRTTMVSVLELSRQGAQCSLSLDCVKLRSRSRIVQISDHPNACSEMSIFLNILALINTVGDQKRIINALM
jgi:hypothetical protein